MEFPLEAIKPHVKMSQMIIDQAIDEKEKISDIKHYLLLGADPNSVFKETINQKQYDIARVLLEHHNFDVINNVQKLQNIINDLLFNLDMYRDRRSTQLSIIYDLNALGMPFNYAINKLIEQNILTRLTDAGKSIDTKTRDIGVFIENGYIPSNEITNKARELDTKLFDFIKMFPKWRYEHLLRYFEKLLQTQNGEHNPLLSYDKCKFMQKILTNTIEKYIPARKKWYEKLTEEEIIETKDAINDFEDKFENMFPKIIKLCGDFETSCKNKVWSRLKNPNIRTRTIFDQRAYDIFIKDTTKTQEEIKFINENKDDMDKCADAGYFSEISDKQKNIELLRLGAEEKLIEKTSDRIPYWVHTTSPTLKQLIKQHKSKHTQIIENLDLTQGCILGIEQPFNRSIVARYDRDIRKNSGVDIYGMVYGDINDSISSFIKENIVKSGIVSMAKLINHPILGDISQQIIINKIYQYIEIFDRLSSSISIENNSASATFGLVLHSHYNNILLQINVGVDMFVATDDDTNVKHTQGKFSNDYIIGNYRENKANKLVKAGLFIERDENTHDYIIDKNNMLFKYFKLTPKHKYNVIITPKRKSLKTQNPFKFVINDEKCLSMGEREPFKTILDNNNKQIMVTTLNPKMSDTELVNKNTHIISQNVERLIKIRKEGPCIYPIRKGKLQKNIGIQTTIYAGVYSLIKGFDPIRNQYTQKHKLIKALGNADEIVKEKKVVTTIVQDISNSKNTSNTFTTSKFNESSYLEINRVSQIGQVVIFVDMDAIKYYFLKIDENTFIELKDSKDIIKQIYILSFPDLQKPVSFEIEFGDLQRDTIKQCGEDNPTKSIKELAQYHTQLTNDYLR